MLRKRLSVLVLGCLGAAMMLRAQERPDVTTIAGHKAHATRLVVRMKAHSPEDAALARPAVKAILESAGLAIETEFSLVPGLLTVNEPKNPVTASAFVSPETRAQTLTQRMQFLKDSGQFDYVEPDHLVTAYLAPNDLRYQDGTLWGLRNTGQDGGVAGMDIDAAKAWDLTTGTNSVLVAVIDTGIRYTHRDLVANIWTNPGEVAGNGIDDDNNGYVDDLHGINAITGTGDPFDDHDHGTHVSGTIGAAANNGEPHVGVTWKVSLMGLKFLSADGSGFDSDAIKCLQYAIKMKAKVSNNSWGGGPPDQSMADALAAARTAGHLFVAAAGNDSADNDVDPHYPATYGLDNIISVAAMDRKGLLASFSDYGQRSVHLGAPGVDIYSSVSGSDSAYDVFSGTSMATPHVVGVAALVLSAHPQAKLFELRQRILNSVIPTPSLSGTTIMGGRVNAFNAVNGDVTGNLQLSVDPQNGTRLLLGTKTPIYARITDIVSVTNATVSATVVGPGFDNVILPFINNGAKPDLEALDGTYSAYFTPTQAGTFQFTFTATAAGKTGLTNVISYVVADRPANDQFARPIKFPAEGGVVLDDTTLATLEAGEPVHAGATNLLNSLWYAWTATASGSVLVDTYGTTATLAVAVYSGTTFSTLKTLGAALPAPNKIGTSVTFTAVAGTTYRIAAGGLGDNAYGAVRIRLTPGAVADVQPPTAFFTDPSNGFTTSQSQITVTGSALDPSPSASGIREVILSLNGQAVTVKGRESWSAIVNLAPGENTLTVAASDFAENASTSTTITVNRRVFSVSNDLFAFATPLTGTDGVVSGTNSAASKEFGEPAHGGSAGGHSIWWTFKAPADGVLSLSTTNSTFDTLLGVYTGTRVDQLTTVASNDDAFTGSGFSAASAAIKSGQTVSIAVDGFSGASGVVSLTYSFQPAKILGLTVTAGTGGSVTPATGAYGKDASINLQATPDPFYEFAGWTGTIISSANPLAFTLVKDTTLTASFQPIVYSDDFETGDLKHLAWTTSGAGTWFVQSAVASRGKDAAQAGPTGNGQSSSLSVQAPSAGGVGSFDLKVSSEAGWDFLEFYLNGTLVQRWSGELAWTTFTFPIPSGVNTFEWRYVKDADRSAGQDTAWLDNVQLRIRPAIDSTSAATVTFTGFLEGKGQISVKGQRNQTYVVQASSDLINWTTLSTTVNSNGSFTVSDTDSGGTARFYRAVVSP